MHSIGYYKYYSRLLSKLRVKSSRILNANLCRTDTVRTWRKIHRAKPHIKAKLKMRKKMRIRAHMEAFAKSNEREHHKYESGIMAPDGALGSDRPSCKHCGLTSHSRRTSRLCLHSTNTGSEYYNPSNSNKK